MSPPKNNTFFMCKEINITLKYRWCKHLGIIKVDETCSYVKQISFGLGKIKSLIHL
jgi:hypothetical protein